MLTYKLQLFRLLGSVIFTCFVVILVRREHVELKYTLFWLFSGLMMILLTVFPRTLEIISNLLGVYEPVNTLFLIANFFLIMIIFSLTVALSRNANRLRQLTQEVAILRNEIEKRSTDS